MLTLAIRTEREHLVDNEIHGSAPQPRAQKGPVVGVGQCVEEAPAGRVAPLSGSAAGTGAIEPRVHGAVFGCDADSSTTANAAIPSPRPVKPMRSVVVALRLTR